MVVVVVGILFRVFVPPDSEIFSLSLSRESLGGRDDINFFVFK